MYGLKVGTHKGVSRCDYHQAQLESVGAVAPSRSASVADTAPVIVLDFPPTISGLSGRNGQSSTVPVTSIVSREEHASAVPGAVDQTGRSSDTITRVTAEECFSAVPQTSVHGSQSPATFATATNATKRRAAAATVAAATPQSPARRGGRPSGTGTFVFRR